MLNHRELTCRQVVLEPTPRVIHFPAVKMDHPNWINLAGYANMVSAYPKTLSQKQRGPSLNRRNQQNRRRGLTVIVLLGIFCLVSFARISNACDGLVIEKLEYGRCTLQGPAFNHLAPSSMHAFRTPGTIFTDFPPAKAFPFSFSIAQCLTSRFIEPVQRELPVWESVDYTFQGRAPPLLSTKAFLS